MSDDRLYMSEHRLHTPVPPGIAALLAGLTAEHLRHVITALVRHRGIPRDAMDRAIRDARQQVHWRRYDEESAAAVAALRGGRPDDPLDLTLDRWRAHDTHFRAARRHYEAADRLFGPVPPTTQEAA